VSAAAALLNSLAQDFAAAASTVDPVLPAIMATGPTVLASAAMAQPASTSTVGTLAAQPPPAVHPLGTADFRSGGTAVAAAAGFALALPSVVAPSVLAPSTSAAVAPVDAVDTSIAMC
jgi:hypothetical protein